MTLKVFISYRRAQTAGDAQSVNQRLKAEFGAGNVFMDVDTIALGTNFVEVLGQAVANCDVLLAIIGPNWLDARDDANNRRLDNVNDTVRVEISTALRRDIPVIPILVEGTRVPSADQLPDELAELSQRQGLRLRHESFEDVMTKLIRDIKKHETTSDVPAAPAHRILPEEANYAFAAFGLAVLFLAFSGMGILPHQSVVLEKMTALLESRSAAWLVLITAVESTVSINVYFPGALVILASMIATDGHLPLVMLVFGYITTGQMIGYVLSYVIGYLIRGRLGTIETFEPPRLKINKRHVQVDLPLPVALLIFSTFFHPHSAALTSYNLGTQAYSPIRFVVWALLSVLVWGAFWTGVCISGVKIIIKETPWDVVFLVYVICWILWIAWRHRRNSKVALARAQAS